MVVIVVVVVVVVVVEVVVVFSIQQYSCTILTYQIFFFVFKSIFVKKVLYVEVII